MKNILTSSFFEFNGLDICSINFIRFFVWNSDSSRESLLVDDDGGGVSIV